MDRGQSDAVARRHVVRREQSGVEQPRPTVLEAVRDAQAYHAVSGKRTQGGGPHAALVEQVGDLRFGVRVEQFVNLTDDPGIGRAVRGDN